MPVSKTRKCEQCAIETPFESLKLFPKDDSKGYVFLCSECGEQLKRRARLKEGAPIQNVPKTAFQKKAAEEQKKPVKKDGFICLRCNYKFKVDLNREGVSYKLRCPYCGREDQLRTLRNNPLL